MSSAFAVTVASRISVDSQKKPVACKVAVADNSEGCKK
jgi:hypothetical protein